MTGSKNLLSYGPTSTPVNGFTTSIADDGALVVSGTGLLPAKGIAWPLDATRFTPGTYTLACTPAFKGNTYVGVWAGPIGDVPARNSLGYVTMNATEGQVKVTAANIATGLYFGICQYSNAPVGDLAATTLRCMLQPAGQSSPWEKPDDVNATGVGGLTQR